MDVQIFEYDWCYLGNRKHKKFLLYNILFLSTVKAKILEIDRQIEWR